MAVVGLGLMLAVPASAKHKKPKERPMRSIPGGASQKWACEQLADNACDVAKRCEPDYSLRHCKKLRDRCARVKDRASHSATEDDVTVCGSAVNDLGCKQVTFNNAYGVKFDLKKLESCAPVAKDDPMPPPLDASDEPEEEAPKKQQPSDDDSE